MESGIPTMERNFVGHKGVINSVDFNPNMRQLASGGGDTHVMVWHFQEQMRAFRYMGHDKPVTCVRFSPSGHLLASASIDHTVRLWTPTIKGDGEMLRAHNAPVRCVEFEPAGFGGGNTLLTGSNDKVVKMWDVKTKRFLRSFTGHTNWVRTASYNPGESALLISGGDDRTVKVWDKRNSKCVKSLENLSGGVTKVAFQPHRNECFAASFDDGSLRLWDIRSFKLLQLYQPKKKCALNDMSFHPLGHFILTAVDDSTLQILDLLEGRVAYTIEAHAGLAAHAVAFSKRGDHFASGGADEKVNVFAWKTSSLDPERLKKMAQKIDSKMLIARETSNAAVATAAAATVSTTTTGEPDRKSNEKNHEPCQHEARIKELEKQIESWEKRAAEATELEKRVEALEKRTTHVMQLEKQVDELNEQLSMSTKTLSLVEQRMSFLEDRFDQFITLAQSAAMFNQPRISVDDSQAE